MDRLPDARVPLLEGIVQFVDVASLHERCRTDRLDYYHGRCPGAFDHEHQRLHHAQGHVDQRAPPPSSVLLVVPSRTRSALLPPSESTRARAERSPRGTRRRRSSQRTGRASRAVLRTMHQASPLGAAARPPAADRGCVCSGASIRPGAIASACADRAGPPQSAARLVVVSSPRVTHTPSRTPDDPQSDVRSASISASNSCLRAAGHSVTTRSASSRA